MAAYNGEEIKPEKKPDAKQVVITVYICCLYIDNDQWIMQIGGIQLVF